MKRLGYIVLAYNVIDISSKTLLKMFIIGIFDKINACLHVPLSFSEFTEILPTCQFHTLTFLRTLGKVGVAIFIFKPSFNVTKVVETYLPIFHII